MQEYLTYTTEETEKLEVIQLSEKLGGNIELAIKQLAESKKQKNRMKMKYILSQKQMKTLAITFAGLLCLFIVACTGQQTDMNKLCGEWKSICEKPDIRIAKDGKYYRLTLFARNGMMGNMEPEIYLIQEKDGTMFIETGFHIDISYDAGKDIITFSTYGDYIRKI